MSLDFPDMPPIPAQCVEIAQIAEGMGCVSASLRLCPFPGDVAPGASYLLDFMTNRLSELNNQLASGVTQSPFPEPLPAGAHPPHQPRH